MNNKKADAGAIATFLLLMAIFIIFYVLLIPPPEREALLGEDKKSETGTAETADGELLLSAFPGEVSPVRDTELMRDIGTISLFSKTGKEIIDLTSFMTLKSRFFGTDTSNLFFSVDDSNNIQEVNLVFFVNGAKGKLRIEVNGLEIYDDELRQEDLPIRIPANMIRTNNEIEFILKSGIFGSEYALSDVKMSVTKKLEKKSALRSFSLTSAEKKGLERATLSYFVNCLSLEEQGTITILLNDRLLYSDFLICDVNIESIEIPPNRIRTGINNLEFKIDTGDYVIEDVAAFFEISERDFPIYNFEVDDSIYRILFNRCYDECVFDCDVNCDDTICLNNCIQDCSEKCNTGNAVLNLRFFGEGRKVMAITINEFQLNIDTFSPLYEADITGFIRRGSNSIKIIPKTEFEIETLQVFAR